jgi:hypothetical protein
VKRPPPIYQPETGTGSRESLAPENMNYYCN